MPCDYSKYPINWKTEIRPRILERAENRCEFCQVRNDEQVFRGLYQNTEIYQYGDGNIYDYPTGNFITNDVMNVEPLNGDLSQKAIRIILTIAHLGHDEENHEVKDERLAALCQKCHLVYDAPEKARRRKAKKYKDSFFPLD